MALHDPVSQSSTPRRQTLPFFIAPSPSDPNSNSNSDSDTNPPLNRNNNSSNNSNNLFSSLTQPILSTPPTPDTANSTPTTPHPVALSPSPSSSPTPLNGANNVNNSVPAAKSPVAAHESPSPSPSPTPVTTTNTTTPNLVVNPKNDSNVTNSPPAATPTRAATNDDDINTTLSRVVPNNARPLVTSHRTLPTSSPTPQADNSSVLSGGAITGIAIVGGIIGFILLFWVGVQLLQSKRRRREEAEMQEIDFYPSGGSAGGGNVNGGMAYPHANAGLDRQPSASNSFNYNKGGPTHYSESQYGEGMRDEGDYLETTHQQYEPGLQRQGTLGGSSAYSGGYYSNPVPTPPSPYTNYTPYSHQFGIPHPQAVYEQHDYKYPLTRAPTVEYHQSHAPSDLLPGEYHPGHAPTNPLTGEYHHGHAPTKPLTGEYHHGHAPQHPPTTIDYQR